MKTLSVQQPWASLICSGVKDIENRTWQPKEVPGRILIHASSKKIPKDYDLKYLLPEEISIISNLRKFGIVPEFEDMPLSAIIGYVDVVGFTTESDSVWAGEGQIHWKLENAYLFDEPIKDVKGKLNLFDYPLDENNLPPAHKVEAKFPVMSGQKLTVYVGDADWSSLQSNPKEYLIDINDPNTVDIICVEDSFDLKETTNIEFIHGNDVMEFEVKEFGWDAYRDEDDQDLSFKQGDEDVPWIYAVYFLGNRIK